VPQAPGAATYRVHGTGVTHPPPASDTRPHLGNAAIARSSSPWLMGTRLGRPHSVIACKSRRRSARVLVTAVFMLDATAAARGRRRQGHLRGTGEYNRTRRPAAGGTSPVHVTPTDEDRYVVIHPTLDLAETGSRRPQSPKKGGRGARRIRRCLTRVRRRVARRALQASGGSESHTDDALWELLSFGKARP